MTGLRASPEVSKFFERLKGYSPDNIAPALEEVRRSLPGGKTDLYSGFLIGEELGQATDQLGQCAAAVLELAKPPLSDRIHQLMNQLKKTEIHIAVVGQIKAGKSTFINALAGRPDYLPVHVNPWTVVPTKLHFGAKGKHVSGAYFEFFTKTEWNRLGQSVTASISIDDKAHADSATQTTRLACRRAALRIGDQFHHLLGNAHRYDRISPEALAHYLCAGPPIDQTSRIPQAGRYADITKVANIYLPMEPFATPTVLIDTPGLNDPSFIRVRTTEQILEYADIYIVILSAKQPMSLADITLLRRLRGLEKRRLLIFINRIDELGGKAEDIDAVESHVRSKIKQEFPEADISVISGSALWANIAIEGASINISQIMDSSAFKLRYQSRPSGFSDNNPIIARDTQRRMVFKASGMSALIHSLSELMFESFLSYKGGTFVKTLKSAAEFGSSTARHELASLDQMMATQKFDRNTADFTLAIAQIEKRLKNTEIVRGSLSAIVEEARQRIQQVLHHDFSTAFEDVITSFAMDQKKTLIKQASENNFRSWRCNSSILVKQLEHEFLDQFTLALQKIIEIHDHCIASVKQHLEQVHSQDDGHPAHYSNLPDIRRALANLGETIEIEIKSPWWFGWSRSNNSLEEKACELEQKIHSVYYPVAQRLAALAVTELTIFEEQIAATLSENVKSTVDGTTERLLILKTRLDEYFQDKQRKSLSQSYGQSHTELTSIKHKYEAVIARISQLEKKTM